MLSGNPGPGRLTVFLKIELIWSHTKLDTKHKLAHIDTQWCTGDTCYIIMKVYLICLKIRLQITPDCSLLTKKRFRGSWSFMWNKLWVKTYYGQFQMCGMRIQKFFGLEIIIPCTTLLTCYSVLICFRCSPIQKILQGKCFVFSTHSFNILFSLRMGYWPSVSDHFDWYCRHALALVSALKCVNLAEYETFHAT